MKNTSKLFFKLFYIYFYQMFWKKTNILRYVWGNFKLVKWTNTYVPIKKTHTHWIYIIIADECGEIKHFDSGEDQSLPQLLHSSRCSQRLWSCQGKRYSIIDQHLARHFKNNHEPIKIQSQREMDYYSKIVPILNICSYNDWNLFWDNKILKTREIMMRFKL